MPKQLGCLVTKNGDSVEALLEEYDQSIRELQEWRDDPCSSVAPCEESTTTSNTTSGSTQSVTREVPISRPASFGTASDGNSIEVSYNISDAVASLNCNRCLSNIELISKGSVIQTAQNERGIFTVNNQTLPVTLRARAVCTKDGNDINIDVERVLREPNAGVREVMISGSRVEVGAFDTTEDRVDHVQQIVEQLQHKANAQDTISLNGITGLEHILADLQTQIATCKTDVSGIDTTCNGVTLCEVNNRLGTLESSISTINSELSSLRDLYETVFRLLQTTQNNA